jgi:hypothetical protein
MIDSDNDPPVDDVFFDRIVDGVLTAVQLRAAVERLEREPGGWKRCALAFLEAQAWAESFRALGESPNAPALEKAKPLVRSSGAAKPGRSGWMRYAVAAGIAAVAFAAGWLGQARRTHHEVRAPVIVQSPPVDAAIASRAQSPEQLPVAADKHSSDLSGSADFPLVAVSTPADVVPVGRTVARLRIGPENATAEVPILAGPGVTEEWIWQQPPPVSERGQVVFQRYGYQVEQHRRLLTTILPDGRRLAVPVDEVQIQYTGNEPL